MNAVKVISGIAVVAMISGCASVNGVNGPRGPRLVGSGKVTELGNYAEVGLEFTSPGDFFALVSPSRWKSPIATGGSLSWVNPAAWSDDPGRTGRILAGQAVIVGGAIAVASSSGGGGGGSSDKGSDPYAPGASPENPVGSPLQ